MARCVILSACPVSPELAVLLRPDDFIIACDAGYRNCVRLGCKANIIVGDFDSAPIPQQGSIGKDDLVILPHVKDDTDTEYAAKLVRQKGFDEVLMLGAMGGKRIEHTLANFSTALALEYSGVRTSLVDAHSRVTFVLPGKTRDYMRDKYFYFSAYPMEGRAEGVCIKGAFYELSDAVVTAQSFALTTSNEFAPGSDRITVSTGSGALLVVETVADHPL